MAYDLHIVRTEDWTEAAREPITRQETDALIAADSELAWSTSDYVDMADEAGISRRYYMIVWRGRPCFWWYRDQIQCSDPDPAQISKLVEMSRVLRAKVVGDDGEVYPMDPQPASSPPTSSAPAPRRWPLWVQLLLALLFGCILFALKLMIFGG